MITTKTQAKTIIIIVADRYYLLRPMMVTLLSITSLHFFEESEKLYNGLVDQLVCEVVNENVAKQSAETTPSSLPALPFEQGGVDDDKQN